MLYGITSYHFFISVPWWTSQRLLLSVLTFLGFLFLYAQRVNLSIAIVSMVDHSHYHDRNGTSDHLSNASIYNDTTNSNFSIGPLANETANDETSLCPQELKKSQTVRHRSWLMFSIFKIKNKSNMLENLNYWVQSRSTINSALFSLNEFIWIAWFLKKFTYFAE